MLVRAEITPLACSTTIRLVRAAESCSFSCWASMLARCCKHADGGDVGERPGDDDVGLVHRDTLVMGRSLDGGEEQGARCDGTLASLEEAPDQNPPRRTSHRALIRLPGTPGLRLRRSRRPHSPVGSTRG